MSLLLSILIASIPERAERLSKLLYELNRQKNFLLSQQPELGADQVEIIDLVTPSYLSGGMTNGQKRQELLNMANGKFLNFSDDDDEVAPNYLETLIRLCQQGKDVVTFRSIVKTDGYWTIINMSLDNATNEETHPRGIVQRTPWHICPVRRKLAIKEKFNPLNHNEDFDWMQRVLKYVRTEAHTDIILTQYNHSEATSEADKIVKHEAATNH